MKRYNTVRDNKDKTAAESKIIGSEIVSSITLKKTIGFYLNLSQHFFVIFTTTLIDLKILPING